MLFYFYLPFLKGTTWSFSFKRKPTWRNGSNHGVCSKQVVFLYYSYIILIILLLFFLSVINLQKCLIFKRIHFIVFLVYLVYVKIYLTFFLLRYSLKGKNGEFVDQIFFWRRPTNWGESEMYAACSSK